MNTKQTIEIELNNPSTQSDNHVRMLEDAADKAYILCVRKENPVGTNAIIMHSGTVKITAIKRSSFQITLKVAKAWNLRSYRKIDTITHHVMRTIIDAEEELKSN